MALSAGSEIKQTRNNISTARAELSEAVQSLTQKLNVKSRVSRGAKQRTQQAVEFGKQNQTGTIAAAVSLLVLVGAFVAWRRSR
ncbi:MAG: hypothetical protein ACRDPW_01050 [Mycobacteriales bacterium]